MNNRLVSKPNILIKVKFKHVHNTAVTKERVEPGNCFVSLLSGEVMPHHSQLMTWDFYLFF